MTRSLLHTMYVDKKLGGVGAVQTLSRLNRTCPGKTGTMVIDFANEAEDIGKAFQPYYESTTLTQGSDPNLLYELESDLYGHPEFDKNGTYELGFLPFDSGPLDAPPFSWRRAKVG